MDTLEILKKLELGTPLFETMPEVKKKRICGMESELAPSNKLGKPVAKFERLPIILQNGGEIYEDMGHIEYASPECSNAASMVAYYEAGKVLCWNAHLSDNLYCHNNDWKGNTFGAHENYFTCAPRKDWVKLIPFLIARPIMCGAGWINKKYEFEISQRAQYITCAQSNSTMSDRAIINLRSESLANVKGWDRFHFIGGDATMSEVATLLRIGTTSLVIEMLEMGALPNIEYKNEDEMIESDSKAVSQRTHNWKLEGVTKGPQSGIELLHLYFSRAKQLFSRRDEVTTAILVIWEDTLDKLVSEPLKLWRRLDWVAKLFILGFFEESEENSTLEWLRAQDMEYHSLDPEKGLYYLLRQCGEMERIVSDKLIIEATVEPPIDTRAHVRGQITKHLAAQGGSRSLCADGWDHLTVVDNEHRRDKWGVEARRFYLSESINDPFETYNGLLKKIKRFLDKH
ncbi:MAG: proteasome accessory factor PafA2 family protein [bacterium]|nr:proteasome accessory factor PafA2 family protein [bacterium]